MKAARFTRIVKIISNWVKCLNFVSQRCLFSISELRNECMYFKGYNPKWANQCFRYCFRCLHVWLKWHTPAFICQSQYFEIRFKPVKSHQGKHRLFIGCISLFSLGASISVSWLRHPYIFYWNAHLKSSFHGPGLN